MIAHILSTGDEVLLGDIVDTNAAFLCSQLKTLGIHVQKITVVGDDINAIAGSIGDIAQAADICLVTGGLGPTRDDLTALACARAARDHLQLNTSALESMKAYFDRRGFVYTRENEKQAMLPSGSCPLQNENGTAPGFYMDIDHCLFFFMPGVPFEMKMMFERQVKPILADKFKIDAQILIERFTVFGLSESKVGALLAGFDKQFSPMRLGFRANFPVIEVKIILTHFVEKRKQAESEMASARKWVSGQLGDKVVSDQGCSMVEVVGQLLTRQNLTLAIAESCTGGLISTMITDVAGSSEYFLFSGVTYSNAAKMAVLNVAEQTLVQYGAVHEKTAREMAVGARLKAGADFAISTTGIAGPGGGSLDKPVGMVCIGLAGPSFSTSKTCQFSFDDRDKNKKMFAMMALEQLRRHLVGLAKTS